MASTGGGPRLAVSPADHEAYIVLTAAICLIWTLLVFAVRLYVRLRMNGPFGRDDSAALVATISAVVQSGVTLAAVHAGIGEKADLLNQDQIDKALKFLYAASMLYIISLCAAKCSMFQLIARLTRNKTHTVASHALTSFTALWGLAALFVAAFQCGLPAPWNTTMQNNCSHLFTGWASIEAFSLLIECLVCAMAVWLVWTLQMSTRLKLVVAGTFLMRVLIIIPTAIRLALLRRDLLSSDSTFTSTDVVIATQVTMHYTVMAATFPCMKVFLRAFNSGLGMTTGLTERAYGSNLSAKESRSGTHKRNATYALESIDRDIGNAMATNSVGFRPDGGHTATTTITSAGNQQSKHERQSHGKKDRSTSLDSDESKLPIIKKTLEWEVRHETRDWS